MRTQKYVLSFLTIALLILTIVGCEKAQKAEEAKPEEWGNVFRLSILILHPVKKGK